MYKIQSVFNVGGVYTRNNSSSYIVRSIKDLNEVIIPHFLKYPLQTQKQVDFLLFKSIIDIIVKGDHLTTEGLHKIVNIKASMNKGLSEELKENFPDYSLPPVVDKPTIPVSDMALENPAWLAGFVEAEGCFFVALYKSNASKTGYAVRLEFVLSQHSRDYTLMHNLMTKLGCGYIRVNKNKSWVEFVVVKFSDVYGTVIPFLAKYPLHGTKKLDFEDFCKVGELMKQKAHLTVEGLNEIRTIKMGMNKGRIVKES